MNDYMKAAMMGCTILNRWEDGIPHHPMSERLGRFLAEHDFKDYDDHFCWKIGGDGDNGESLMYQMDPFFEMLDKHEPAKLVLLMNSLKDQINDVYNPDGFESWDDIGYDEKPDEYDTILDALKDEAELDEGQQVRIQVLEEVIDKLQHILETGELNE